MYTEKAVGRSCTTGNGYSIKKNIKKIKECYFSSYFSEILVLKHKIYQNMLLRKSLDISELHINVGNGHTNKANI